MPLPFYSEVSADLQQYVEEEILPQYDHFDAAHQRDHGEEVIRESIRLAQYYPVNPNMVFAIAAFHDLGLCKNREHHHEISANIILNTPQLHHWFTPTEIRVMAEAAEDHRASAGNEPRSIYGKIVAEADRLIDTDLVIRRTLQYQLSHTPGLDKEEYYSHLVRHLNEKYASGGYLRLWIPESNNAKKLSELREVIANRQQLRQIFNRLFEEETLFTHPLNK